MDANGTYMLVRYGAEPSVRVYDRRNLAAGPYANPIDGSTSIDAGSYLALTPDGQYVVGYDSAGGCCRMGRGVSWKIDHATRTVTPALTEFWSLCGDHATFLSASDGRNYMLATNCTNRWEVWRADITNNARGLGEDQQRALPNNKLLKAWPHWENNEVHYSAVAKGPLRDWAFVATEYGADTFNSGTADANGRVTPWNVYRQEIIAVNILTGEMRRLAHHRSRSLSADYYNTPRLTASWGGEYVAWNSNFNQSGSIDAYAVVFGGPSRGGSQAELPRQHPTGPRLAPAGRTGADSPR
jgi:hypothetical protein